MRTTALLIALLLATVATANSSCGDETCASAQDVPEDTMELMQTHGGASVRKSHAAAQVTDHNVNKMLDYIKTTIRKGKLPPADTEKVAVIKELIEGTLLPTLMSVRNDGETEVQGLVENIGVCNTDSGALQTSVGATGDIVNSSRGEHVACRNNEAAALAAKEAAHDDLQGLISTIPTLPVRPAAGASIAAFRSYVGEVQTMSCATNIDMRFTDKDTIYTNTTNEHEAVQENCNHHQRQFEQNFCAWRIELIDACQTLEACYGAALTAYNTRSESLALLVQQWKTEFTGLKKILCYVDIWMSDNNAETVDENKGGECDGLVVDTSPMELVFPAAPAQLGCDTDPVHKYPCNPDFLDAEYSHISNAAACTATCPAAASQPADTTAETDARGDSPLELER